MSRYNPDPNDSIALDSMTEEGRLHYFLTRAAESEEIWGLSSEAGWVMKELDQHTILSVWPYQVFADACATGDWQAYSPNAISLEHFVYNTLQLMIEQGIQVEIMPTPTKAGKVLNAEELFKLFEGLLDSGEYFMEG